MFGWLKKRSAPAPERADSPPATQPAAELVSPETLTQLAFGHMSARRWSEAMVAFHRVLLLEPRNPQALFQLANIPGLLGQWPAARQACDRGLALISDHADLLTLSAHIAKEMGEYELALSTLQQLADAHPNLPTTQLRMGDVFCILGRGAEAIAAFDRAIAQDPEELNRRSVRLYFLNYFGLGSRQSIFEAHRSWGQMIDEAWLPLRQPHDNDLTLERPLRIGLVSGDLRTHAVAYFIEGYLREHDDEKFPLHCFDVSPHPEDDRTAQLRRYVQHWHRVAALSDDALATEIRRNKIDVLVDLSGHTMHNRLLTFTQRPAPIQVSWFGYMNTTGLTSIDYRFTDAGVDSDPTTAQHYYTEKLFYLPSLACFAPDARSPAVAPPPFLKRGRVRFISANQWTKVTDEAKSLWAQILCDESRPSLKILALGGETPEFQLAVISQFVALGVNAEQIEVHPFMALPEFLARFDEVDVALDTFPYGGGTTTLHTIWMGVPIIALEGETELGRATPAMLRAFGVPDFVAHTTDEYRDKAIAIARNPERLTEIRANLRQRMAESAAVDAKSLARNVEGAFRTMWHTYCSSVNEPQPTAASVTSTHPTHD